MATIDKIYGTHDQYFELYDWCSENIPEACKFFYGEREDLNHDEERTLANFPYRIDKYLIQNCPIEFVQDRLVVQYGDEYDAILNEGNKV